MISFVSYSLILQNSTTLNWMIVFFRRGQRQVPVVGEYSRRNRLGIITFILLYILDCLTSVHCHSSASSSSDSSVSILHSHIVTIHRGGGCESEDSMPSSSGAKSSNGCNVVEAIEDNDDEEDPTLVIGGGAINEKKRRTTILTDKQPRQQQQQQVKQQEEGTSVVRKQDSSNYRPSMIKSHLGHALEGLDRYPRYLSRWSLEDTESLEQALEEKLEQVREQKQQVIEKRNEFDRLIQKLLTQKQDDSKKEVVWESVLLKPPQSWEEVQSKILHPDAAKAIFGSIALSTRRRRKRTTTIQKQQQQQQRQFPSIQDVINGIYDIELDASYLEGLMDQEVYDVYSFPLLSNSFCKLIQNYIRELIQILDESTIEEFPQLKGKKIGIRNFGTVKDLDMIGLQWLNDLIFHFILRPISRHLFYENETLGKELDWRQGYITTYTVNPSITKPRTHLIPHTDDSEVTLNICLGDNFDGGLLNFKGLRGNDNDYGNNGRTLIGTYQPQIGRAIIHSGRHFHEVTDITSGNRFAYIMWARSWNGIRSQICPCCWLNNRRDDKNGNTNSCICGPRWN